MHSRKPYMWLVGERSSYAIRNVDHILFGFTTPSHVIEADRPNHPVRDAASAALAYAAITVLMTWPLARGLARDIPGDFGDPLLNAWILAWDSDHILRALTGHFDALRNYWNANIFYPNPLALAYSEHLTAQALQILPVYAVTQNAILCYNLVFLGTFILSGLGMFLWTRELTGRRDVAFVAGLAFAFAPYRVGAMPHLQVISSAWMPFTLFGFRRFFETRRMRPLWGAVAAWILQNLSCGYYLLFFSPVVAGYLVWELTTRRRWTDTQTMARLVAAGVVVVAVTGVFTYPYYELRQLGFAPRPLFEVDHFSADVYSYLTTDENLRVIGWLQAYPKAEGALFPGFTVIAFAWFAMAMTWRRSRAAAADRSSRNTAVLCLRLATALGATTSLAMTFGWTLHASLFGVPVKITDYDRVLIVTIVAMLALLAVSAEDRRSAASWMRSPVGFVAALTLFCFVMSLGPHVDARGRTVEEHNVYLAFYRRVPGFDGLRVPARFAMIVALGLATLAAQGLAAVRRFRRWLPIAAALLIVAEGWAVPLPINQYSPEYRQGGLAPLPLTVGTGRRAPPVYRFVNAQLPHDAAIIELPLGEVAFDVRYEFYSTNHWRRLVNGYSGGAPAEYGLLTEALKDLFTRPDRAWAVMMRSAPTHAIVHETGYDGDRGHQVSEWLRANGARELGYLYGDRVFELPARR